MPKTITGSIAGTVTLVAGDDPVLVQPLGYVYGAAIGIYGADSVPWTITNQGTIIGIAPASTSVAAAGIVLTAGGSVDNSGTISGYYSGVTITGASGLVTNSGLISGSDASTASIGVELGASGSVANTTTGATITGAYDGVAIYGALGTVTNAGTISAGGANGFAVVLKQGGSVYNQAPGGVQGVISGYQVGVDVEGDSGTVTNLGTIVGSVEFGVILAMGGSVVNGVSGSTDSGIYGLVNGVYVPDGDGTIINYGTIASGTCGCGTYDGVLIDAGGTVTNAPGALIAGYQAGVVIVDSGATVFNAGSIAATYGVGVALGGGGTITNAAGGSIYGLAYGINVGFGPATVLNSGSIGSGTCGCGTYDGIFLQAGGAVTNASGATITGYANGVYIRSDYGTVVNSGGVYALTEGGIRLAHGGSVTNSGSAASIYGGSFGVIVTGQAGTVSNDGTITGALTAGGLAGVYLAAGGSVSNAATGTISGDYDGNSLGAEGTVTNDGLITGTTIAGVVFYQGGTLTNTAGAVITGAEGVQMTGTGGVGITLVNAGTITAYGSLNIAVAFEAPNDLLVFVPGAVFNGSVQGGGTDSTIELASASNAGSLAGLGVGFNGFTAVQVDAGAQWSITGQNTVDPATPVTIDPGASLDVTGVLSGGADFALIQAGLHLVNAISPGDTFDFDDVGNVGSDTLTLDAVSGTGFDNAITGFSDLDSIVLPNVTFVAGSTPVLDAGTLSVDLVGGGTFTFGDFALQSGAPAAFIVTDHAIQDVPVCFARGTRILTEVGEVAVETLCAGDRVVTLRGDTTELQPIVWIGRRRIQPARHSHPDAVHPVRIRRDAFAEGQPHRDLLVSPEHCVAADGMLIPARRLVNGISIAQEAGAGSIEYFHVELDRHTLLFAEGLPAESYLDTGNRGFFANAPAPVLLHATPAPVTSRRSAEACLPFPKDDAAVAAAWRRLAARAAEQGGEAPVPLTTREPQLRLRARERVQRPVSATDGRYVFTLPPGTTAISLLSRADAPTLTCPWLNDCRRLGVAVCRITLSSGSHRTTLPVDHPALTAGWWQPESDGAASWRWTAGDAAIALPPGTAWTIVEIQLRAMEALAYRLAA